MIAAGFHAQISLALGKKCRKNDFQNASFLYFMPGPACGAQAMTFNFKCRAAEARSADALIELPQIRSRDLVAIWEGCAR
jgi:hypothetical protein